MMKNIYKSIKINALKQTMLVCASGMILLASGCSSTDEDKLVDGKKKGEPTFFTMNMELSGVASSRFRAGGDIYSTEKEIKIDTVDVFLYNESGFCDSHVAVPGNEFTLEGGVYKTNNRIPAATGNKKIFVTANLPASLVGKLENGMLNEATQVAQTLRLGDLVKSGSIIMTSEPVACELLASNMANENVLTIPIKRMTAKITVEKSPSLIFGGVSGKTENLLFAVANFNERSFLSQRSDLHDPNWAEADFNPNEFYPRYDENDDSRYSYVAVNNANIPNIAAYNTLYAAENTSELHRKKEITRILVRATFIPDLAVVKEGDNFVSKQTSSMGITSPTDFWVVALFNPQRELYFFYTYSYAADFALAHQIPVNEENIIHYIGGKCYWDIFLNGSNQWDVLRNDYYKCIINRIMSPGRALPAVPDPDEKPDAETSIDASISITPWTLITGGYELTP
ncbi:MAG: Mfa1 family fimbria major subunit [Dysgonamonadaceae bacterium]|jgi:hypothetical protein|nr:Mfa1 family fimbria major subunit [Dysgonamonadaceae bacterium]